jgi:hypothetical protein
MDQENISSVHLHVGFLLSLHFNPEVGVDMFLLNANLISVNYAAWSTQPSQYKSGATWKKK